MATAMSTIVGATPGNGDGGAGGGLNGYLGESTSLNNDQPDIVLMEDQTKWLRSGLYVTDLEFPNAPKIFNVSTALPADYQLLETVQMPPNTRAVAGGRHIRPVYVGNLGVWLGEKCVYEQNLTTNVVRIINNVSLNARTVHSSFTSSGVVLGDKAYWLISSTVIEVLDLTTYEYSTVTIAAATWYYLKVVNGLLCVSGGNRIEYSNDGGATWSSFARSGIYHDVVYHDGFYWMTTGTDTLLKVDNWNVGTAVINSLGVTSFTYGKISIVGNKWVIVGTVGNVLNIAVSNDNATTWTAYTATPTILPAGNARFTDSTLIHTGSEWYYFTGGGGSTSIYPVVKSNADATVWTSLSMGTQNAYLNKHVTYIGGVFYFHAYTQKNEQEVSISFVKMNAADEITVIFRRLFCTIDQTYMFYVGGQAYHFCDWVIYRQVNEFEWESVLLDVTNIMIDPDGTLIWMSYDRTKLFTGTNFEDYVEVPLPTMLTNEVITHYRRSSIGGVVVVTQRLTNTGRTTANYIGSTPWCYYTPDLGVTWHNLQLRNIACYVQDVMFGKDGDFIGSITIVGGGATTIVRTLLTDLNNITSIAVLNIQGQTLTDTVNTRGKFVYFGDWLTTVQVVDDGAFSRVYFGAITAATTMTMRSTPTGSLAASYRVGPLRYNTSAGITWDRIVSGLESEHYGYFLPGCYCDLTGYLRESESTIPFVNKAQPTIYVDRALFIAGSYVIRKDGGLLYAVHGENQIEIYRRIYYSGISKQVNTVDTRTYFRIE